MADQGSSASLGRILREAGANGGSPTFTQVAGGGTSAAPLRQVKNPDGVALNANNNLFVADSGNNRILRFANGVAGPPTVLCPLSISLVAPALGQ